MLKKETNNDDLSAGEQLPQAMSSDYFEEQKDEYGLTSWDHTHELLLLIFCALLLFGIFMKVVFL